MNKLTTLEIEIIVAKYFDSRVNVIVPNISWGMFIHHECDLLLLTPAGYGYEIEIKTSLQDLKKDMEKVHGHKSKKIKCLYFALPESLTKHIEYIPKRAGILSISENRNLPIWSRCKKIRKAEINCNYKFSDKERYNLARLGAMRIWTLKDILRRLLAQQRQANLNRTIPQ